MNQASYDNPLRRQILSLPELVETQLETCFGPGLQELMSMAEIFDTRKIILTGCGDSYVAAIAMAPVIERYCDCFGVTVMRAVEFCRFLPKEDIGIGEPNSPLVIVISAGGGTARICEALQKANQVGAFSILLTNKQSSKAVAIAKRVYFLDTPAFPNDSPGLRSYFASLLGLVAFACRIGHVRGTLPPTAPGDFRSAIAEYVGRYAAAFESVDRQMLALAQRWADFNRFDFVADHVELASAAISADKFAECNGCFCSVSDSEDWCHINYFLKDPGQIGTVFFADKHANGFGRIVESAASAKKIGRPVLVVTNAGADAFAEGIEVCTLPDAPAGFGWLLPLMDFTPAALLAGYLAELQGEKYFRMAFAADGTPDRSNPYFNPETLTLGTSKIEIYD